MTLASAIRSAVGGRGKRSRLEDEKPEDLEEENKAEDENGDTPPADDGEEDKPEEAEDEEKDPADEKDGGQYARGRRAERSRMAAILGSPKADANPTLAAHLAFNTGMNSKDAVATLSASGATSAASSLGSRMQGRVPALGNGGNQPGAKSPDAALIAHAQARKAARSNKR